MTWAATYWGQICQRIADFVTDVDEGFPEFSVGIGPDAADLHDGSERITFVPLDAGFEDPRAGGGLDTHGTFDETIPVRVHIQVREDIDTVTNLDRSPALLERVFERFLEGLDREEHTPYGAPISHGRRGGRIGEHGSASIVVIRLRVEYHRTPATFGTATTTTTTIGVEGPDGNGGTAVDSFEVIGEPSP